MKTLHGTPGGDSDMVSFSLAGQDFMAISAGPVFKINQSVSFILNFDPSRDEHASQTLDACWEKLADGGEVLMEKKAYPFSKQYGWVQDKFGVSWQLMLTDPAGEDRPFITPSLMFAGANTNKAEEAINFYVSVFKDSRVGNLARYPADTGPAKAGSLMYGDFMCEGMWLAAMDSGVERNVTFNEAISLLVRCDTQEEIDYYWEKLSAVPEAEQCGWLKDKYGFSWQIAPTTMDEMMRSTDPAQLQRVTDAFLKMKKFDLAALEKAYKG